MKYEYGFIGIGNMGSALVGALAKKVDPSRIAVSNRSPKKAETLADRFGCTVCTNAEIAENAHYIILGVKPQVLPEVLPGLSEPLQKNVEREGQKPILVTMAAGVKMAALCEMVHDAYPVIRIMPNTPVAIGQGVILTCSNEETPSSAVADFTENFSEAGLIKILPESLIDAGSVISGCGPAYIYMYIDAIAKTGEALGLDYETAALLAKATARGAAALSELSDDTLENLRIAVCSPGGTTIEGVQSFLDSDLDGTVQKALEKAYKRTKELAGE